MVWRPSLSAHLYALVAKPTPRCDGKGLAKWIHGHLNPIDSELMWEFGPGIQTGHRLVITPESKRHLRPLVDEILAAAPSLPGWSFHAWRLAENLAMTRHTIEARTGTSWTATGCRVSAGEKHLVDVAFTYPPVELAKDLQLVRRQTFVACETLFGEEQLDRWSGAIESLPAATDDLPLEDAATAFARIKNQIIASRQQDLCLQRAEGSEWTGWKLKPKKADDYPWQSDLFYGSSLYPELWTAAHSGGIFHSSRFSAREVFCYLKLDGKEGIEEEGFADKAEIEDAVNAALIPTGLGCHYRRRYRTSVFLH
jgi:hypothetical protein